MAQLAQSAATVPMLSQRKPATATRNE